MGKKFSIERREYNVGACMGNGRGFQGNGFRTIMCQGGNTVNFYSNDWRSLNGNPMGSSGTNGFDCACVVATNTPDLTCFNTAFVNRTQAPSTSEAHFLYADQRSRQSYTIAPGPGATFSIEPDAKFSIRAGTYVDLRPGFWAKEGSNFRARRMRCYDSDPKNAPIIFRVKSQEDALAEADEMKEVFDLSVQPNPFENNVLLVLETFETSAISIEIIDAFGHLVDRIMDQEALPIGQMTRKIDTRNWASGLYIIQVRAGQKVKYTKVIKQ
ncbi:MAG: T9SS type A sorting domain-containing protein [Bacteroidota bacterium]